MKLKLLNYNILGGFYLNEIKQHLNFDDYDLICFQEFPFKNIKLDFEKKFNSVKSKFLYLPADDDVLGNSIFYNPKIKHLRSKILKIKAPQLSFKERFFNRLNIGDTTDYKMNQLISHFQIGNTRLTLSNLHLFWESDGKFFKDQLNIVFDKLKKINNPIVITGDFNTRNFIKRNILRNKMKQNGYLEAEKPNHKTLDLFSRYAFPSNRALKLKRFLSRFKFLNNFRYGEFDYIFYKNLPKKPIISMPDSQGSDHAPLVLEFRLP